MSLNTTSKWFLNTFRDGDSTTSLIKICNKLVGPTFEPLFLNLTPGTHINRKVSEYEAVLLERCSRLSYQKYGFLQLQEVHTEKFQTIIWKDNTLTAGILPTTP